VSTPGELDQDRVDEFAGRILNDGSRMMLAPLAYIGDRLNLFESLYEEGPLTPEAFGEVTSCDARYLEEWLSAMASAQWIEYDPERGTFDLPPEHALFLVDEDSVHYLAGFLEQAHAMAEMADDLMNCFRSGGGLTMEQHHPDMPRLIDRAGAPAFKNFLPDVWIGELLPEVDRRLREGGRVADVGCGSGRALTEMARGYPNSRFEGFEPNEASAERARRRVRKEGLEDRITIHASPASAMSPDNYDLVTTFDVIHDLPEPQAVIDAIRAALRPGGTYLMQEINASEKLEDMRGPLGTMLYSISTMYCLTVSLAHDGAGIGTCMGESLPRDMCGEAGFASFERLPFEHPFFVVYAARTLESPEEAAGGVEKGV